MESFKTWKKTSWNNLSAFSYLANNDFVVIKFTDEGGAIVITDKDKYTSVCEEVLRQNFLWSKPHLQRGA